MEPTELEIIEAARYYLANPRFQESNPEEYANALRMQAEGVLDGPLATSNLVEATRSPDIGDAAVVAAELVPDSKSCCELRCADGCKARAPRSRRVVVVR